MEQLAHPVVFLQLVGSISLAIVLYFQYRYYSYLRIVRVYVITKTLFPFIVHLVFTFMYWAMGKEGYYFNYNFNVFIQNLAFDVITAFIIVKLLYIVYRKYDLCVFECIAVLMIMYSYKLAHIINLPPFFYLILE